MLAFSRITSLLLFVLSLSFLTCALPTSVGHSNALTTRDQGAELLKICADLEVDVKAKVDAIAKVDLSVVVLADVQTQVNGIIGTVNTATKAIAAIGLNLDIDVNVRAQIAAHIAVVIKLIVNLCITLIAKLGVTVLLGLLIQVDLCLKGLLIAVKGVVVGLLAVVVELLAGITVKVLADVHLTLIVNILAPLGLAL